MLSSILSIDRLAVLALFATCFSSLPLAAPTGAQIFGLEKRACSTPLKMGTSKAFGGLAASTLTSTGNTAITGNPGTGSAGVYPGTSITGFPPGTVTGALQAGTVIAQTAEADCSTAYYNGLACPVDTALLVSDPGGLTLSPGVYTFSTSAVTLTGTLTLSATGTKGKGQFIFKVTTTFAAAALSKIVLTNTAVACNVYFLIGSSATIGAGAILNGNFIAYTSIAVSEAASNKGTLCALNGAVTLINNALVAQTATCPI